MKLWASARMQPSIGSPGRRSRHFIADTATSRQGFSLIELIVVMVAVAILSGVAATSLSGLNSSRQNVAATRVRTALIHAQLWAMSSSYDTWVAFDVPNDLVSVWVEDPSNPGKVNRLALLDPLTRSAMTVQLGLDGAGLETASLGSSSEVQFDRLGTPYNANGIVLSSDGTIGITGGNTVRITRNTGLVTVD